MLTKFRNVISSIGNLNENEKLIQFRDGLTRPFAIALNRIGISPTMLNLSGLLLGMISSVLVGLGDFRLAAVTFLLSGLSDAFDGALARYQDVASDFGNFFDAVCDRYVDVSILSGIAWHYFPNQKLLSLLALVSIVGVSVTSYAKARAESLAVSGRYVGLMNRPERIIAIIIGLFFPQMLPAVLWILAILSNITAIHRILFYTVELRKRSIQL